MTDQKYCPCGGIILADTEDWNIPLCNGCYEDMNCPSTEPRCMPKIAALLTRVTAERDEWKAVKVAEANQLQSQAAQLAEAKRLHDADRGWLKAMQESRNVLAAQLAGMRELISDCAGAQTVDEAWEQSERCYDFIKSDSPATEWEKRIAGLVEAVREVTKVMPPNIYGGPFPALHAALDAWDQK